MDRSWLLFMPPAGLSAWSRMTRVGRLRHQDTRLWMDLQSGTVTLHLDKPFACTLTRQDLDGRIWLGVELRQGDVRMSIQARVHEQDLPGQAQAGSCDGPRVSRKTFFQVLPLLTPAPE